MSRRSLAHLAIALALFAPVPSPIAAQRQASAATTAALPASRTSRLPKAPGALKAAYEVRLTSTWPQSAAPGGCRNGGEEVLEGTLTRRIDGMYTGTLSRRTRMLFCGAHGPRSGGGGASSCALTLEGAGLVHAAGVVTSDETSPSGRALRFNWTPAHDHQARVSGACSTAFKSAVRAMYLSAPHGVEFGLTTAGAGQRTERLESYAWRVEQR